MAGKALGQFDRRVEVDAQALVARRQLRARAFGLLRQRGGQHVDRGTCDAAALRQRAAQCLRQQRFEWCHQRRHGRGGAGAHAVQQPVQGVERRQRCHERLVERMQLARLRAAQASLEEGGGAARFQRGDVGGEAQVVQFRFGGRQPVFQHLAAETEEALIARLHGAQHLRAVRARQQHVVHGDRHQHAEPHFGGARDGQRKHIGRVVQRRHGDHACRVPGQHEAVGLLVAVHRGAGRAQRDPQREAGKQGRRLLREQRHQGQRRRAADHGAQQAVQRLLEHHAGRGQRQHERRRHGRQRRIEAEAQCQPQRAIRRRQHAHDEQQAFAVGRDPALQGAARGTGKVGQAGCGRCCGVGCHRSSRDPDARREPLRCCPSFPAAGRTAVPAAGCLPA